MKGRYTRGLSFMGQTATCGRCWLALGSYQDIQCLEAFQLIIPIKLKTTNKNKTNNNKKKLLNFTANWLQWEFHWLLWLIATTVATFFPSQIQPSARDGHVQRILIDAYFLMVFSESWEPSGCCAVHNTIKEHSKATSQALISFLLPSLM